MRFSFRRSRPGQLLLAWSVYWVGLALITLGPAIAALWHLSQVTGHGSANVSFNNGILSATVVDGANTAWSGSISLLSLALRVTVPPLLLWLAWFAGSPRTNPAKEIARKPGQKRAELYAPEPGIGINGISTHSTSKRQAREES
ncbi:MAG TPA: hypothetical protein VK481_03625 [Gemmatimonadaceae bacterium]|nr:hypothetical protein [Gemmatimonadaceae bacterium]